MGPRFRGDDDYCFDDDRATLAIEKLEEHFESMIRDATKAVEAKLDATLSNIEAMQQVQSRRTAFLGAMIAIVGIAFAAGPFIAKLGY